jgi:hypothetical protein
MQRSGLAVGLWLLSVAACAWADEVITPILERKLDRAKLEAVAPLTRTELVAKLREEGLRVLVVPLRPREAVDDANAPKDRLENVAEDRDIVRVYEDWALRGPLFATESSQAMFLAPYVPVDHRITDPATVSVRPLAAEPVLVVSPRATRYEILHEYVHFLLWQSAKPEPTVVDGKPLAPVFAVKLERERLAPEFRKLQRELSGAIDEMVRMTLENELALATLRAMELQLEYDRLVYGEEMDVNRMLLAEADTLRLSPTERRHALGFFRYALVRVLAAVETHRELVEAGELERSLPDDGTTLERWSDVRATLERAENRYRLAREWFNETFENSLD